MRACRSAVSIVTGMATCVLVSSCGRLQYAPGVAAGDDARVEADADVRPGDGGALDGSVDPSPDGSLDASLDAFVEIALDGSLDAPGEPRLDASVEEPLDAARDASTALDGGPLVPVDIVEMGSAVTVVDHGENIGGVSYAALSSELGITHGDLGGVARMRFTRIDAAGTPAVVAVPFGSSNDTSPKLAWNGTRVLTAFAGGSGPDRTAVNPLGLDGVSLAGRDSAVTPSGSRSRFASIAALGEVFVVVTVQDGVLSATRVAADAAVLTPTQAVSPPVALGLLAVPRVQANAGQLVVHWAETSGEGGFLRLGADFAVTCENRLPGVRVLAVAPQGETSAAILDDGPSYALTVFGPDCAELATRAYFGASDGTSASATLAPIGMGFAVLYLAGGSVQLAILDDAGRVVGGPVTVATDTNLASLHLWWTGTELRAFYVSGAIGSRQRLFMHRYRIGGTG